MNFADPNVSLIYGRPNSGKSTLSKFLVDILRNFCKSYYVIGRCSESTASKLKLQATCKEDFSYEEVDAWRRSPECKLLIMDDIMHINFTGKTRTQINDIMSTARHHNMYIIVCTHLLKSIGKIFRLSCENFITFMIDEDSLDQLSVFCGKKKSELRGISLEKYQFIYAHTTGQIKKMSITITPIE